VNAPLIVLGCGGHGKVVAEAALASGRKVLGFADDNAALRGAQILGLPVIAIGREELLARCRVEASEIALAFGDNFRRSTVFSELTASGVRLSAIVHPRAVVSPSATVGDGAVVFAGAIVNADAHIGEGVILNTAVTVDHDGDIGAFAHLSPGVHLGGTVCVGAGTHLGLGALVRNNVRVGSWSMVGMGAVVVRDLPDDVLALGIPARVVRRALLRPQ
jgi:acetyltransferase EpsM